MAKKKPKREKRYAGKTEKEWRDWGERFGKRMEKIGKVFGEEMEDFTERVAKHAEHKHWERRFKEKCFGPFGVFGPFFSSIFGILLVLILYWVLSWVNFHVGNTFTYGLANFLNIYMPWIFLVFLFFNYTDYFSKKYWRNFWMIRPITTSIKIIIFILFLVLIFNLASVFQSLSNFLYTNILNFFVFFLIIGYIVVFVRKNLELSGKRWGT